MVGKLSYLDRTIAAIEKHFPDASHIYVSVEDIYKTVIAQAEENNETVGRRPKQYITAALLRLRATKHIKYEPSRRNYSDEDDEEHVRLTDRGKTLLEAIWRDVARETERAARNLTPRERHRIVIIGFHTNVTGKLARLPTLKALVRELRELKYDYDKLSRAYNKTKTADLSTPSISSASSSQQEGVGEDSAMGEAGPSNVPPTPTRSAFGDDQMQQDIDNEMAGPSRLTTTLTRTATYHSVGGLPSPGPEPMEVNDIELTTMAPSGSLNPPQFPLERELMPLGYPRQPDDPETPLHRTGSFNDPNAYPSPTSIQRPTASGSGACGSQAGRASNPEQASNPVPRTSYWKKFPWSRFEAILGTSGTSTPGAVPGEELRKEVMRLKKKVKELEERIKILTEENKHLKIGEEGREAAEREVAELKGKKNHFAKQLAAMAAEMRQ